jgi:uncharacterized membrane protein YczE
VARHTAPRLRGGTVARALFLVCGLAVFAAGIVCLYEARLGLSSWDVLNLGLHKHSPLSFGEANIVVGCSVLVVAMLLGARVGAGTVANAILVGTFVDLFLRAHAVRSLAHSPLAARVGLLVLGIVLMGIATALYVGASFGAGPRDSLMLALARATHMRIGLVRGLLEAAATGFGFLLGGTVGIGTLVFVLAIGPVVEASFDVLDRSPLSHAQVALAGG